VVKNENEKGEKAGTKLVDGEVHLIAL